jgi:DNA-binding Lrp family transcriptional regulator
MNKKHHKIMRVLRRLAEARDNIFNTHDFPVNAEALARELKFKVDEVVGICDALAEAGVIERIDAGADYPYYKLPKKVAVVGR